MVVVCTFYGKKASWQCVWSHIEVHLLECIAVVRLETLDSLRDCGSSGIFVRYWWCMVYGLCEFGCIVIT